MDLCYSEKAKVQYIKDEIEELRNKLNHLTSFNRNGSFDDEILHLSQCLDEFICAYYKAQIKD